MKATKKKLIPLPKLLKRAEKVFNSYIRRRDEGLMCISCDNPGDQAGHYFPVKGFSALRFSEFNVNLQCSGCNCYKHGNQIFYRQGLVKKIGEAAVQELERVANFERVKKWDRQSLEEIIKKYSK